MFFVELVIPRKSLNGFYSNRKHVDRNDTVALVYLAFQKAFENFFTNLEIKLSQARRESYTLPTH